MLKIAYLSLVIGCLSLASCGSKNDSKKGDSTPPIDLASQAPAESPVYGFWEIDTPSARGPNFSLKRIKLELGAISAVATCGIQNEKIFVAKAVASITPTTIEILENKKEVVKNEGSTCNVSISKTEEPVRYELSNANQILTLINDKSGEKFTFVKLDETGKRKRIRITTPN